MIAIGLLALGKQQKLSHIKECNLFCTPSDPSALGAIMVNAETSMIQLTVVTPWPKPDPQVAWNEVTAVAVDADDHVHVFARQPNLVYVFNDEGDLLDTWGAGHFARPHGLTIDSFGRFYCTDDLDHTIKVFSPEREFLYQVGKSGCPSDTGATSIDYRTIVRAGPPFYFPTNVAVADDGTWFATDGYGNARVHHFSAAGDCLRSWGAPGAGPGEFHVPHGIALDRQQQLYVADRENHRIQRFDRAGNYLGAWNNIARPCQIAFDAQGYAWVAELGYRAGMWPGTFPPSSDAPGGRLCVYDADGKLIRAWGGGEHPTAPGDFFAPHDVAINSRGDIYVAEVVMSAGGNRGLVDPSCHALQKFRRTS